MRRKMLEQLIAWKQNGAGKTALLIDGARRVGKRAIVWSSLPARNTAAIF